tara:strand:- start:1893 stop:2597 length:705 start_codon:yes stop_codon:yes gene_type:complete
MKTTNVVEFFERVGYDWRSDLNKLSTIYHFTKTRHNLNKNEGDMSFGAEQCFFVKAVANSIKASKFFEVGTGRGTACYAVSLEDTIDEIITIDIVSHYQKKKEAIGYREAIVSNEDLYGLIPFEEKEKIKFKHVSEVPFFVDELEGEFDLAFIDGNHTDAEVIKKDFETCNRLVRENGIILFDDYHPKKFKVKEVADRVLEQNPSFKAELVCFHGHLFDTDKKVEDYGILMVTK